MSRSDVVSSNLLTLLADLARAQPALREEARGP